MCIRVFTHQFDSSYYGEAVLVAINEVGLIGTYSNRNCNTAGCDVYHKRVFGEKFKLGQPYGYILQIDGDMFPSWSPSYWHAICLLQNSRNKVVAA